MIDCSSCQLFAQVFCRRGSLPCVRDLTRPHRFDYHSLRLVDWKLCPLPARVDTRLNYAHSWSTLKY